MNQNQARVLLLSGLATFAVSFGGELMKAHEWAEVMTPGFVGITLIQLGGVGVAVWGALKVRA
jgi:hypothetical protein